MFEMGKAEDWQTKLTNDLKELKSGKVVIFNPRRDNWDSSWKQEMGKNKFTEQVTWELDHLDKADIVVLYFDPKTKSPITLLEMGLHATDERVVVCCPEGFFRKGMGEKVIVQVLNVFAALLPGDLQGGLMKVDTDHSLGFCCHFPG